MKIKEYWWVFLIIVVAIMGTVLAIKYLPFMVTMLAIWSLAFGIASGWYLRGLYNKYFPDNK